MTDAGVIFDQAWDILRHHNKGVRMTRETLNRLFREQLEYLCPRLAPNAPHLWEHNLAPTLVDWGRDDLSTLWRLDCDANPRCVSPPIIVVVFRGYRCLIDGRRRVNRALAPTGSGRHAVILMTVLETIG